MRAAIVLVLLLLPLPARAATVRLLTDAEQARASDAVVLATVTAQRVERSAGLGRTVTISALAVEEVLAGAAPPAIELTQLGGTLDGRTEALPGDLRLKAGERVVLFLRRAGDRWLSTALEQSKYEVVATRFGPVLRRPPLEALLLAPGDHGLEPVEEPARRPARKLAALRDALGSAP